MSFFRISGFRSVCAVTEYGEGKKQPQILRDAQDDSALGSRLCAGFGIVPVSSATLPLLKYNARVGGDFPGTDENSSKRLETLDLPARVFQAVQPFEESDRVVRGINQPL